MRSRVVGIFKRVKDSDLLSKGREKVDKLGNQGSFSLVVLSVLA